MLVEYFISSVPERGTGRRPDRRSAWKAIWPAAHIALENARIKFLPSRELKDIGDHWPRFTTEFHDACVAGGRSQHAHEWRRRVALPRREPLQLFGPARFRCGDTVGDLSATSAQGDTLHVWELRLNPPVFNLQLIPQRSQGYPNTVWIEGAVGELESETLGTDYGNHCQRT